MSELIVGLFVQTVVTLVIYGALTIIIAFTLWMVVDAAKQDRFWWVVIIWGVPGIGPAVYYLTEKKHEYAKAPIHHIHDSETEAQHETTPKHHTHHKKEESVEKKEIEVEVENLEEKKEEDKKQKESV